MKIREGALRLLERTEFGLIEDLMIVANAALMGVQADVAANAARDGNVPETKLLQIEAQRWSWPCVCSRTGPRSST